MEFTFVCGLHSGLHARPSSCLSELATQFASETTLTNTRNEMVANLKSVLAIIAADVRRDDTCRVRVTGADDKVACLALQSFVGGELFACDGAEAKVVKDVQGGPLPRSLHQAGVACYPGVSVSRGIGQGRVVVVGEIALPPEFRAKKAGDPEEEQEAIAGAVAAVRKRIAGKEFLASKTSVTEAAVLRAHLAIVNDIALANKLAEGIAAGRSAGQAVAEAAEFFTTLLRQSESAYIRERALDVQEICIQLLAEIYGADFHPPAVALNQLSIIVAETLAPQQLLALDRQWLKGLVLQSGGATSHTVILARSLGIPTLVGVKDASILLSSGQEVVVDANRGLLVPQWTPAVQRFYEREWCTLRRRRSVLSRRAKQTATTTDGHKLEVAANVASAAELIPAFENGADGIGLFRTEMLFAGRDTAPPEEEQFEIYAEAARAAGCRPVIIRMLDIGGDKSFPLFDLPKEDNPFLGCRGVRIYPAHRELIDAHLRAILRASGVGPIRLMIPMVSCLEEVLWVKARIAEVQSDLRTRSVAFDAAMPVGIMIEVPSVVFVLDQLCQEVDFFSVGTNDLSQYFFAADRNNTQVAELSSVRHPSFVRLLKQVVEEVHKEGKWVGMCGEMAGDIHLLPLLVAIGLDEISLTGSEIPAIKEGISRLSAARCEELLQQVMACRQVREVDDLLQRTTPEALEEAKPLLDPGLVLLSSESKSKEEAIQEIVDAFYVAGRTEDRQGLEDALWAREAVYSTGLGYGFAIPHCKSDAVAAGSIGILKLNDPVPWGSLDGQPVHMVIMLAMRESDANRRHMQIFSALARKLMDEQFRDRLLLAEDAAAITAYLDKELAIAQ